MSEDYAALDASETDEDRLVAQSLKSRRSMQWIIEHADELARKFEDFEPE